MMSKRIWGKLTLKWKTFICFSFIIIFLCILSSASHFAMSKTYKQFNQVYSILNTLDEYSKKIEKMHGFLNKYISENDRTYISLFYQEYDELFSEINDLELSYVELEETMALANIKNMLRTYGEEANGAINEYRKRNLELSSSNLVQTQKIKTYMLDSINDLTFKYITRSRIFQKAMLTKITILRIYVTALAISPILLFLSIAFYFRKSIIRPIHMIVKIGDKLSHGQFDSEHIDINSNDELKILSDILYNMGTQIQNYIEEVKQKGEVEKLLQAKEMENLRIKALLQETELKRLQAQVNPHFLFNTLTTLHHTAFMEGAEETCEIAQAISKILRYNLRKSNTIVQLKDEIENIRYYLFIQEKRYKHRMNFKFEIDEMQMELPIPNMSIQPIVENAFIHGIENSEKGGEIVIAVYCRDEFVVVEVRDNGPSLNKEKLEQIRNLVEEPEENRAHTSSIGINNVVKRLQAFYNKRTRFYIDASPNEGTIVRLYLPADFGNKRSQEMDHDINPVFLEVKND